LLALANLLFGKQLKTEELPGHFHRGTENEGLPCNGWGGFYQTTVVQAASCRLHMLPAVPQLLASSPQNSARKRPHLQFALAPGTVANTIEHSNFALTTSMTLLEYRVCWLLHYMWNPSDTMNRTQKTSTCLLVLDVVKTVRP
jgi:hypothetical protein